MKSWIQQVFFMELRKMITYRADFWVNFFGQTLFSLTIAYFLWKSIFTSSNVTQMNGYNIEGMIFYYLIVPLIFRIQQGQGIGFISREIYDGSLNKYLLYPIDIFRYKLATYLANSGFYFLQLLLILLIYNLIFYDPNIYDFSVLNLICFVIIMINAAFTFFYLFTICEFMAFWFDNIWSLGVILRFLTSFLGGALIPLSFFPEWAQSILSYTPFPYLIDFPMKALTGSLTISTFCINLSIAFTWLLVFRALSKFTWTKGKYSYSGVGM